MEYLPEKNRTQKMQTIKKEEKLKGFREYLANSDTVLAMVKCKSDNLSTITSSSLKWIINMFFLFRYSSSKASPTLASRSINSLKRLLRLA